MILRNVTQWDVFKEDIKKNYQIRQEQQEAIQIILKPEFPNALILNAIK